MLLTVDIQKNDFYGDRYYFNSMLDGFCWSNGKKLIGIIEEKNRVNISANNKKEIIKYLLKIKKSVNRMMSSYFIDKIIESLRG